MNSLDQPDHSAEPPPAEDGSPRGETSGVPTQPELKWPYVRALRDLEGSAQRKEIRDRVSVLIELTEHQKAIQLSDGRSKFENNLDWVSDKLRQQGVITYPSSGSRELTPLGWTITESQLDAPSGGTVPAGSTTAPAGDLAAMVEQFRRDTAYPTESDEEQKRLREEWGEKLRPENIESLSPRDLTGVASNGVLGNSRYVYPDVRGVMMWIEALDDASYARLIEHIHYLCWDEDELSIRYDALTDRSSPRKTNDFGDAATSKVLAICYPERFLPISVSYNKGREAMLQRLDLPGPRGSSHGQRVVDANDRLRDHLAPYLGNDLYGMATFLYWLMDQEIPKREGQDQGDHPREEPPLISEPDLVGLADRLLVDESLLEDIVDLLEDKRQVILYGPPGTGKTHLARELAKELAPVESCRTLVQFHPSTSYEDFFEGYRPAVSTGGEGIRYELTPGPLARMAERATEAPDEQHIMIIDEINRGNLPRVLGELLFLLEYRNESVQTLYRPDDPFSLPENLWFIGTMNTADRSIALVDAALRRRFHFVPFFPDDGAMKGLLGRWLTRKNQPAWVGELVDRVNDELKRDLKGSDQLLGPSHFMNDYGTTRAEQQERLRRIWEYNIKPLIEDQFFGDPDGIQKYRFADVLARHGPAARSDTAADLGADTTPATPAATAEESAAADTGDQEDEASAATEADPL